MDDGYGHPGIFLAAAAIAVIAGYLIWRYRKSKAENVTEEDIKTMVNEGHEQGVLESSEAEMISNIFEFDDKEAGDIMTHRKNIVALDGSMTVREASRFVLKEASNSRFPVYGEDLDDIIGTVHIRMCWFMRRIPGKRRRLFAWFRECLGRLILFRKPAISILCLRKCSLRRFIWKS